MTPVELEIKYLPHVKRVGSLTLIPASQAMCLLSDLSGVDAKFLGVEAFRLFDDGGVQPAMEFSNISYGRIERKGEETEFHPDFGLRDGWRSDPLALQRSIDMIARGSAAGYTWYEVHIEDPSTNEELFFHYNSKAGA